MYEVGFAMAAAAYLVEEHREAAFLAYVDSLPQDMRASVIQKHEEQKEKRRLEAIAERRHKELCDAIRSTRPQGFGLFW